MSGVGQGKAGGLYCRQRPQRGAPERGREKRRPVRSGQKDVGAALSSVAPRNESAAHP